MHSAKHFPIFREVSDSLYQPAKTINLKFNVARAFRAPSIRNWLLMAPMKERPGMNTASRITKRNWGTQLDAAIEVNREHFSVNIAGYYNNFSNFIFYRAPVGNRWWFNRCGRWRRSYGFQVRPAQNVSSPAWKQHWISIRIRRLVHLENTFSLVSGKLKEAIEGSDNLPFIPAPKLLTEIRTGFQEALKILPESLPGNAGTRKYFRQSHPFTAYNTELQPSCGYSLLNFGVGTDICNSKGKNDR